MQSLWNNNLSAILAKITLEYYTWIIMDKYTRPTDFHVDIMLSQCFKFICSTGSNRQRKYTEFRKYLYSPRENNLFFVPTYECNFIIFSIFQHSFLKLYFKQITMSHKSFYICLDTYYNVRISFSNFEYNIIYVIRCMQCT